jgi:hypothetical protein
LPVFPGREEYSYHKKRKKARYFLKKGRNTYTVVIGDWWSGEWGKDRRQRTDDG